MTFKIYNMEEFKFNIIFNNGLKKTVLSVKGDTSIQELINKYYENMEKGNLGDENIENTYFIYNCETINYKDNNETVRKFFNGFFDLEIFVYHLEYKRSYRDYKKTRTIKDNIYTCVDEAKVYDDYLGRDKLVAVKKIKKERLK